MCRNYSSAAGVRVRVTRLVLLMVVLIAVAAPAAEAAPRKAPPTFFGTVWDGEATGAPAAAQDAQWSAMQSNGVQAVRTTFSWTLAQPVAGAPFDLSHSDAVV